MLKEINEARLNPQAYAEKIKMHIKNIFTDENNISFFYMEHNSKINLPRGKRAFEECIEFLKNLKPRKPLQIVDELKIAFPEKTPELATSREYITSSLLHKADSLKNRYNINWFHYDNNIRNAEISVVLQLVDDNNSHGERRKHLLDDKVDYVGINIGQVRKNMFCIYLVFAS
jgi:hypothetical protein